MNKVSNPNKSTLISAEDLADILRVKPKDIYQYCKFFDQDPNDEWVLNEEEHFFYINKKLGARKFTKAGALELAKYVEETVDINNPWRKIVKTFFDRRHKKYVRSCVMERVADVGGVKKGMSIQNGRAFVNTQKTRYILRLANRQDLLNSALEYEQRGEEHGRPPMKTGHHFIDEPDETGLSYSAEGIKRLSMALQNICKSRSTKSWNSAVSESILQTLKEVSKPLIADSKKLAQITKLAKNKSKQYCEVTKRKKSNTNLDFSLTAHHLYDKSTYDFLQYEINNVIAIDSKLHIAFHSWMGGFNKSCTAEDFLQWLKIQSDEIFDGCDDEVAQEAAAIANIKRRIQLIRPALDIREEDSKENK